MLILKLGGAAITDKDTPNTPRPDMIRRIAEVLAQHPQPMVLVHGAGSFGHIIAREYTLHEGYKHENQRDALVQLQLQLHTLNRLVVEALCAAGLPAMSVHPASMCVMSGGRITSLYIEPIRAMLKLNLLPVLYGDCVWDTEQVFGIISGDQLVVYLANELGADRVAFGTNVDGVLDAAGKVLPQLNIAAAHISDHSQPERADVTGGMLGKLNEIAALQNPAAETWIFNLQNLDHLRRVLSGQGGAGTRILSDKG